MLTLRIPVPMAGPRCDGVVGRWPLGSGVLAHALNLADPHGLLARSGDRVGLISTGIRHVNTSDLRD